MRATPGNNMLRVRGLQGLLALASIAVPASAYQCPVRPRIEQHPVTGTLGEHRRATASTAAHFHNGIDIGENGATVYAIEGGIAYTVPGGSSVAMGHFRYVHLTGISVRNGEYHPAGHQLGTTDGHLHLSECDVVLTTTDPQQLPPPGGHRLNPLREGGSTPFYDFALPIVQEARICRGASFSPPSLASEDV